jgi:hypothetical protein
MTSLEAQTIQIHAQFNDSHTHAQNSKPQQQENNFISTILKNKNQIKLIRAADANYMNQAMFNKYA